MPRPGNILLTQNSPAGMTEGILFTHFLQLPNFLTEELRRIVSNLITKEHSFVLSQFEINQ